MARRLFLFDDPQRFVAGTLGEPGNRSFFLQARQGEAVISVALEKTQVAALAQRLAELLLAAAGEGISGPKEEQAGIDDGGLEGPVTGVFQVGLLTIGWDGTSGTVVLEARPADLEPDIPAADEDPEDGDMFRVRLSAARARAFAQQATTVVMAGRPTCPFCGQPLEPTGHFCPRTNGQLN